MLLQLLSDLHLETEAFDPSPAPGAELLVLAGDIDAGHAALDRFAGWPVPVVYVPGNHEFDLRDVDEALAALRARCEALGLSMLHRETLIVRDGTRRLRLLGCIGWSDFLLLGERERDRCMRAAAFFLDNVQRSTRGGRPFGAADVLAEGAIDRAWLQAELGRGRSGPHWDETLVITHFAPLGPQRRSPIRTAAVIGQFLQRAGRPVRAGRSLDPRPRPLPARLRRRRHPREVQRPRAQRPGGVGTLRGPLPRRDLTAPTPGCAPVRIALR